ncbi:acetyltransferase [Sphingopyxis flava]|uniref:Sugar O-acyltransferase, sialic acid O-acetyltransferase NeuD family n=1 Tax=Sphingopyxis flava TaxID=1507287 RepID=A0A1T5F6A2_9SPHN|nr:acetyltransferase [Sphingopyxis flava]SKB91707.1 sugar O-acyltransferase, sialic acid O-acetyltransferase NeuD family [Sphingopyxis flava]
MTRLIGIYGAGGCGRGIMPLARTLSGGTSAYLVFIDDRAPAGPINGHAAWSFSRFLMEDASEKHVALAVAAPPVRVEMARKCDEAGLALLSIWAKEVVVMDDVEIAEGALVSPFVTFTSNIRIGRCFHANLYSYVEHDCVIGDFVTFAPGVRCNGNVRIGDRAYIGSGAVIRQNLTIGADAVVGMGAVVTKDVPPGVTVVGNPARVLRR